MKKFLLAIVIALMSVASYAGETPYEVKYYDNGNIMYEITEHTDAFEEDYWYTYTAYFKDGTIRETGGFNGCGDKEGWFVNYYENGIVSQKVYYNDGRRDGALYIYNEYGMLVMSGNYKYGRKHGEFKKWSESSGDLVEHMTYKRNKLKEHYKWEEDRGGLLIVKN